MEITLAACQIQTYADPHASADKVIAWVEQAAAAGVQVLAFPEACLCGYACDADYWQRASPAAFAQAEDRVAAACAQHGVAVVLGSVHWDGGRLFNSVLVLDTDGKRLGRYAKTHLAEQWPTPGRELPILAPAGIPSCFIICHDVRYPELVRLPAACGARICYFCSNESGLLQEHKLSAYRAMPIARATENGIYLVMANAPGDPADLHSPSQSHGNSKIIHPDGNVLDEAGFLEERLVTATVDLEQATGAMARRAVEDETRLTAWMRQGLRLVQYDQE
jgi:predicted amidohydrolase